MGLISWLQSIIDSKVTDTEIDIEAFFLTAECHIRNLAFYSAINLIANSISKCEFKTFLNYEEVKGREYYLFNVEPNKNQNSSQFMCKLITKLHENNECLVVEADGQLLIADSFTVKEYALYDNQFSQVRVGSFTFNKTFMMSDVLYFRLNNKNIRNLLNGMYESHEKLIAYGQQSYQKTRGQKGILNIGTVAQNAPDFNEKFKKLMNDYFKNFFEADSAVLPLFNGYDYTDIGSKTYNNETTRDIRALIDDVFDITARAFGIPPVVLRGEHANNGDAVDNYLTFCIDPLCDMLQEEINRKRSGYAGFSKGTFLKIDTKSIKHIDLLSVASSVDKLIGSGAFTINDIRELVGDEPINEAFANEHFMTKNYSTVDEFLKSMIERSDVSEKTVGNKAVDTS